MDGTGDIFSSTPVIVAGEVGVLTITKQTAAELAAHAAINAAAESGEGNAEDAATSASFSTEYRALYDKQLLESIGSGSRNLAVYSFEIDADHVDALKETFMNKLDPPLPIMVEYDFRNDSAVMIPRLEMTLRNPGELRPYQERCLR